MGLFAPPIRTMEAKATSGVGAFWMTHEQTVESVTRSPQKLMREAQEVSLYNRHIRAAERVIAQRFSTVPWHLEDGEDEEVNDESPENLRAIRELIEKPYRPAPGDPLNSSPRTRSGLWGLTCRHMGVCGNAFWYLDQAEALAGTPLQTLYINPARMTPATDGQSNLLGWVLDSDNRGGGTALERKDVLHFVLEPPDTGHFGHGLVESAMSMVTLGRMVDRQATGVLAAGGRLAGVFSPKADAIPADQFEQLKTDLRTIAEAPDAVKRALVLQGPIDFTRTSATPLELDLLGVANMARDDVLELWGMPGSSLGISAPAGLNSGGSKDADEPILWQNAVGPRLRTFRETLQFELLDRYAQMGITVELEIEEPEFDDDAPMYEIAAKAERLPLSNDERRAQVGMEPLDPKVYGDLGSKVYIPAILVDISEPPAPTPPQLASFTGQAPEPVIPEEEEGEEQPFAKARPLRKMVDTRFMPAIRKAVQMVLDEQRADLASRSDHMARKPKETSWWNADKWDKRLMEALRPYVTAIGETVSADIAKRFAPAKASTPNVLARLLKDVAKRVVGINDTTRDKISAVIAANPGVGGAELGRLVRDATAFDQARAEVIARSESAHVLNGAQLAQFEEFGVSRVEAIDGDEDPECAERNGTVYDIEEAMSIEDHPNGTLDWAPVLT